MMNKMIVSNLAYRPVRSAISIIAIGIEVTLILLIVGFSLGMLNDSRSRQAGIGADVIVLPPGSSNLVAVTGAPMPVKIGDLIAKLPHVAVVAPVYIQISTGRGHLQNLYGIDLPSYEGLHPFRYLSGGPFESPDDVIVDDIYANGNHVKVGDNVDLLNQNFRIAGIVAHGQGARIFLELGKLQELNGGQGKSSAFYVKADKAANAETVVQEIKNIPHMDTYGVHSMSEYLSMLTPDNIPMLSTFIRIVIGIAVTIGFIVIFQAMYAAVMERTREIGILKSLGASKFYIINAILRETTVLSICGIIVGFLISLAARVAIQSRTTLPVDITSAWILRAIVIAIVGSLLGAIYPALKAAQKDPIDALAYE
ncbi:MAG TPA: FtsX-like permease family protein [Terriglobales bacterium]|jgi:putative ABC transport system permease protein|nr:FtsX-like permease family protein [Terriglobales bacterium]